MARGKRSPATLALVTVFASLFSRSASLFSRSASPVTVARYRGTAAGWQPIGSRTSHTDAARLLATLKRIDPAATVRLSG